MRTHEDPVWGRLRGLERNVLKARALEMTLVLFHAEQLRAEILDAVQEQDDAWRRLTGDPNRRDRVPKGTSRAVPKCLNALTAEGVFSAAEKAEIVKLIDYRNTIAHSIQELTADVGGVRHALDHVRYRAPSAPKYDAAALKRVRHFRALLSERRDRHLITRLPFDDLVFRAADKTYTDELKRLRKKIDRQIDERRREVDALNAELAVRDPELTGEMAPGHPLMQYDDGRLTARGQEVCYRLYDLGKSSMAVAILMRLNLKSAMKRRAMWQAAGGSARLRPDLNTLPRRVFYARYED